MFSLRDTLELLRTAGQGVSPGYLPPGYNINMGIVMLCGRRPASITILRRIRCPQSFVVHFKSLISMTNNVSDFMNTQFIAMQRLFAEEDIAVMRGTTE